MATLETGALGCIGAWVLRRLLAAGERPVLYDVGEEPWRLRIRDLGPKPRTRLADGVPKRSRSSSASRERAGSTPEN